MGVRISDGIDMLLTSLDVTRQVVNMANRVMDIEIIDGGIEFERKRIQMYSGIEYLANMLGATTMTEPFGEGDTKEMKSFEYKGYTFFQLGDTDPDDGSTYYR